ncbi:MAG: DUF2637 domain-containing protein [Kineosporiaceae bacterium]
MSTTPPPGVPLSPTVAPFVAGSPVEEEAETRAARLLRAWAIVVLVPVALVGAALSFDGLHSRAREVFTDPLAYAFPLLVDALILGCTLAYLAGAKIGRPRGGWRLAAHAGIAGTIGLNATAAHTWAEVPWHVTAPIVWSVLVELTGKELLGEWRARHRPAQASIPVRLWLTAPAESARTWLRIARRLDGEQTEARLDVGVHAAAMHALELAVPGWRNRKVRRILRRQLRAGSLSPAAILGPLGWTDDASATLTRIDGPSVLKAALREAINRGLPPVAAPPAAAATRPAAAATPPAPPPSAPASAPAPPPPAPAPQAVAPQAVAPQAVAPQAVAPQAIAPQAVAVAPVVPLITPAPTPSPGPSPAATTTTDDRWGERHLAAMEVLRRHGPELPLPEFVAHMKAQGWDDLLPGAWESHLVTARKDVAAQLQVERVATPRLTVAR